MAINFPSNPTNSQEITEGNVTYVYNATKGYWESSEGSSSGASTTVYADMTALIAATGMSNGDQAFVTGNNNLYIYSGSGWYKVATVQNDAPSAITGVSGTYELAIDGTATTITAVSTDPEGFPLTWSYSASGLGSIATVSQTDNVFTITPSTTIADAGTFSLTINATDGINGAVSTTTNLTLEFIVTVTNSKYTTLLATATDTSDNNNITDASSNNHTITVNGDAYAGTFSPYRVGGYSTYFDGSSGGLQVAADSSIAIHTDFTIECWFYLDNNTNSTQAIFSCDTGISSNGLCVQNNNGTELILRYGGQTKLVNATNVFELNRWYHIALTYDQSASTLTLYIDGQQYYQNTSISLSNTNTSYLTIGALGAGYTGYSHVGYIRDFRFSSEVVYTSNFTSPTESLSNTSATEVLTCHLPYIADGSTNGHSITVNSNVSTKPFSPYDNLEYSAADHGGSVYFDGTGDALRIADNSNIQLGTSAFTIEGWFYCNDTNPTQGIIAKRDASGEYWRWIITGGNLNFRFQSVGGGSFACNTVSVPTKTWCHFAVTRDSNNDVRQFVNGISTQNAINSTGNFDISGSSLRVGEYELNTGHFSGFVSDIKIIKNSALYTTDFTPPNAPLSSSGAELHIKGTDASIIDKSQGANIKLVGNTTGSTTQVKFADTKSIYFDGTGDEIQTPTSELFRYGTGDFTWEFWTNPSSQGTYDYIITQGSSPAGTSGLGLYLQGGVFKVYHSGAAIIIGTTSISNNTWYHVALAREGTTMRLFLDGTLEGSATNSADIQPGTSYGVVIGRWTEIGDSQYYDGYLQDLRVTKGLARYTANFTPPTASLEG